MSKPIDDNTLEEILREQINKIVQNEKLEGYKIRIKKLPCTGRNYTGALYLITINDTAKGTLELFGKVSNVTEHVRQYLPSLEMYNRERFVYKKVSHIYDELQNKHGIPEDLRYRFPKYYGSSNKIMEESIILENLVTIGYDVPDRFESVNWNYAAMAINELAKFHALSFAFEKENPTLFNEIMKTKHEFLCSGNNVSDEIAEKYRRAVFKSILEITSPKNVEIVKQFLGRMTKQSWYDQMKCQKRSALVHGDYRISNLMTKYEENNIVDIIPVDYQTVYYGSPINDVIYFVITGTDEQFRSKYFDELVEHYYKCLTDFLALLGIDVQDAYSKEDFDSDLKERLIYGFYLGLFSLPYILSEEKPDLDKNLEDICEKHGKCFIERFNGIVNDYVKWNLL